MKLYAKIGDLGIRVPAHLEDSTCDSNQKLGEAKGYVRVVE